MTNKQIFWFSCLAMLNLTGCDNRPDQWDAFIYPNRHDLTTNETIRGFKTLELCQKAAIDRLSVISDPSGGDYECGYKCEAHGSLGGNVCEETTR
jgi:hypothetical protein